MIKLFRNLKIKEKLLVISMLVSGLAVISACVAFVINDFVSLRTQEVRKMGIIADVIGRNTQAALAFNDAKAAQENLSALSAERHIDAACVYDAHGSPFAFYRREGRRETFDFPTMGHAAYYFKGRYLNLFHDIALNSENIGAIYMRSDLSGVYELIRQRILIVVLILLFAFGVAFLLSARLQKVISDPILHLADVAHTVSRDKNYSIRATKQSEDEIGFLVDGFNEMLNQIQTRDFQLQARAIELAKTNQDLQKEIEERKRTQEQLLQSQKMQTVGTLAGGIAHDLNNQLTPITGYVDLILGETDPLSPAYALLLKANQAAKRCGDIVQRLMRFTRPSTQRKNLLRIEFILEEVKTLFPKFLPSTILTKLKCESGLWPVLGNETEIQSVLMNLLTNARDAMPNGGQLLIHARNIDMSDDMLTSKAPVKHPGPYVVISVTDTGIGMPPAVLQRIFEPFFTTKEVGQGTGLGLSMVFNIVRDHQGWVDVSSEENKGTTFQIYLPGQPEVGINKDKERGIMSALPGGSETILFADDEEELRNMGKLFLEHLGYRVLIATNGEEALAVYTEHQAEIGGIVMDMTMPKMTGRAACRKIMQINPKAKIMLVSGYTSEGEPTDLTKDGICDFLAKPYTILPLATGLRKMLDRPT